MDLYINTTKDNNTKIALEIREKGKTLARTECKAEFHQAEKLLPALDKLLEDNALKLNDIKKIFVNNRGGSFTALRIGIVTANALVYALGCEIAPLDKSRNKFGAVKERNIKVVVPEYSGQPNITKKKK